MSALVAKVGNRIRALRELHGMRQQDLAHKIGMTRASISNLEAGRQNIGIEQLEAIAAHLQVRPGELLDDDATPAAIVNRKQLYVKALDRAEERAIAAVRRTFAEERVRL